MRGPSTLILGLICLVAYPFFFCFRCARPEAEGDSGSSNSIGGGVAILDIFKRSIEGVLAPMLFLLFFGGITWLLGPAVGALALGLWVGGYVLTLTLSKERTLEDTREILFFLPRSLAWAMKAIVKSLRG